MATEISLKEFCRDNTQTRAAQIIGRTPGAISQMLAAGRQVYIVDNGDGTYSSYERKVIKPTAE
jgi:hypothetical protein